MFVKMSTKQNSFVSSISEFVIVAFQVIYIVIRSCMANLLWFVDKNYKGIKDDVVLITGGGQGIGRQLAVEFAKHKPKQVSARIIYNYMHDIVTVLLITR